MKAIIKAVTSASIIGLGLLTSSFACYYRAGAVIVVRPRPRPNVVIVRPVPPPRGTVVVYASPRYYVAPPHTVIVAGRAR